MPGRPTPRTKWLPREPGPGAAARVFCIPYSGCGASIYRRWPRQRDGVEFLPLEMPGHETRFTEPIVGSYQDLAKSMAADLEPYLDVPYAFFGHCWSALAAYEVTAELTREGAPPPAHLFVSSQVAPQDGPVSRMLDMGDEELAGELARMIEEFGGTPHPDLVELYLEVLRADVDLNRKYVMPEPYRLSCPITAIGWTEDSEVRPDEMGGWPRCGETTFEVFEGRHTRFIEAPPELLGVIVDRLVRR